MRLASFSVRKYRSIVQAEKLPLSDLTILIGPNNEGKSNILRALVVGMRILSQARPVGVVRGTYRTSLARFRDDYVWERDFPISLQDSEPSGDSIFDYEFVLDEAEIADFYREVRSNLNGNLPIRLSVNPRRILFHVTKRGPGAKVLSAKRDEIAQFVGSRLQLQYVPAIRTADEAAQVVRELVEHELAVAESDPEYTQALEAIARLQAPILESLSHTLSTTLRDFLPEVRGVSVDVPRDSRSTALRRDVQIIVDDGTATDLRQKGDGVQSLAALSLIRYGSQASARAREQMLAVEEPEAHLHPDAIHQLRRVFQEISAHQQIVVTTHCPVLVNRLAVDSNIIVQSSNARPATSVREIRDVLGVRTSDNLASADVVLIVEGESDRVALRALLADADSLFARALKDGLLAIDTLGGGSNLGYKIGLIRDSLCVPHAFLDNDEEGRLAAEKAQNEGLLTPSEITFAMAPGMTNSEIEDLYERDLYGELIRTGWGVDLNNAVFKSGKAKWSDRVKAVFIASGKQWNSGVEKAIKTGVAERVVGAADSPLQPAKRGVIDALVGEMLHKLRSASAS